MKKFNELDKNQQELVLKMISDLKEKSIIKLYNSFASLFSDSDTRGMHTNLCFSPNQESQPPPASNNN